MKDTGRFQVTRYENVVMLTLGCKDEYAAMLLFDTIERELAGGLLELKIAAPEYVKKGDLDG